MQVLFAPIPGQATGIAGGYIFGAYLGTLYSLIGITIGSFFVFYLSRKFGRPFVEKMVNKGILKKYDKLIMTKGVSFLFLIYLLPVLPDDTISYLAGLTKIKIKTLVLACAIGRLPGFFILSLIGAGFSTKNVGLLIVLIALIGGASILIFFNREKLENKMEEILRKFDKKLEKN